MPPLTIRYSLYRRRWSPLVPLTLISSQRSIQSEGYLDSGAFYSVFRLELLSRLGLQPRQGKARYMVVADGSFIPVHIFRLPVEMVGQRFITEIAFSDRLGVGFNVIGRKGIFEHFEEIIFRERRREVEFRRSAEEG
jgi:hypothetical protein